MTNVQTYVASTAMPVSPEAAFAYHDRPGALERLIPPWESVRVERSDQSLAVGSQVVLRTSLMGIPLRWVAEHTKYEPPHLFADTQVSGPFAAWDHEHHFQGDGHDHSLLRDQVTYQLPAGVLGRVFGSGLARQKLESMFAYRHHVTRSDLALMQSLPTDPIKVAVSGSTGLVGTQLSSLLTLLGHDVRRLVRKPSDEDRDIAAWSGEANEERKLGEVDAVVHLAGKPIAKRWNANLKQEIRDSRVTKTRELCEALARSANKPKVLISASAIGIYGDRGDELLNEQSEPDDSFLADVATQWEQACQPAIDAGIRVVNARLGLVLSPRGGALQKMMLPAKFAGGSLGSGKQWLSWIALDDVIGSIIHMILTESVSGPVNLVSPEPIRNRNFARVLGSVIGRPALFSAPAFALRAALGEMADALLLCSARAEATKLQESGYEFRFTDLHALLRYSLGYDRLESSE